MLGATLLLLAPAADAAEGGLPFAVATGIPEVTGEGVRVSVAVGPPPGLTDLREARFSVTYRLGVLAGCFPECAEEPSSGAFLGPPDCVVSAGPGEFLSVPCADRPAERLLAGVESLPCSFPEDRVDGAAGSPRACDLILMRGEGFVAAFRGAGDPGAPFPEGWVGEASHHAGLDLAANEGPAPGWRVEERVAPAGPVAGSAWCRAAAAAGSLSREEACGWHARLPTSGPEGLAPLRPFPAGDVDVPELRWLGRPLDVSMDGPAARTFALFVKSGELPPWIQARDHAFVVGIQVGDQPQVYVLPAGATYVPVAAAAGPTGFWGLANQAFGAPEANAAAAAVAATGLAAALVKRFDLFAILPPPLPFRFTRLQRRKLLDQETRRRIYEAIRAEPAIRFADLRARTGLPVGVLTHHLHLLEEHDFIVSERRGRQRHLFLTGTRDDAGELAGALTGRQREILDLLRREALAQRDLAARLGVTQQAASYHLRQLMVEGHVVRERGASGAWVYGPRDGAAVPSERVTPARHRALTGAVNAVPRVAPSA